MDQLKSKLSTLLQSFQEFFEDVQKQVDALESQKAAFEAQKKLCAQSNANQKNTVLLDVGGRFYRTTTDTLKTEKGCMLDVLFSGAFAREEQPDGSVFIDRDPTHFDQILGYLRDPESFVVPTKKEHLNALYREARFYGMDKLMRILEEAQKPRLPPPISLKFTHFDAQRYQASSDGLTLAKVSHNGARAAVGNVEIRSGRHSWTVRTTTPFFAMGVASTNVHAEVLPGSDNNSWVFFGTTQEVWHRSRSTIYGQVLREGDVVGATFDFDVENGSLSFTINGVAQGTAFKDLAHSGPFYPVAYLYSKIGFSCTLLSYTTTQPALASQPGVGADTTNG